MQIIRGTTPTVTINVRSEIDLSQVTDIWVYIYQQNEIIIDKQLTDVQIDAAARKITVNLSQEDTLNLKAGVGALFQVRLLLSGGIALATLATNVMIAEVYKDGIIGG